MNTTLNSKISATTAVDCKVKTARDEAVGSIKDLMINTTTNEIDYVVLKVDEGFLNLGSKLLALPMESFNFHPVQEDVIIVKETKETLENAPGFDKDSWPSGPQAEFLHTMRTYYSEEPRSLYGRYDHQNAVFYTREDRFDQGTDRIRGEEYGDGFLERDHRGTRQSEVRRGGEPLL
ncbi:PRC-barrel domain-containing protein [Algoriphagus halophytocola]|uniref:PRC-barrel domain-containing protein n=1 Tax=Algoriphagus halophytocola TaxID=2991499 RepID=A0ABY6MGJ2_9BACT|nr:MULTISPECIES: PRC-barrel domain-containing protein [unclassified Algoriphagus]UZD22907.1 PRC-barrel domain-containing protein [Algoriphagus sp. TR-M5]WBL44175.1 PRC-barrel domain-containing protein [Algoriphagus sp. TR-M9]